VSKLTGIDEKTPLLRSMDAVKKEGLRLLKASGLGKDVQTIYGTLALTEYQ
jgi:glutamine synthetase type III